MQTDQPIENTTGISSNTISSESEKSKGCGAAAGMVVARNMIEPAVPVSSERENPEETMDGGMDVEVGAHPYSSSDFPQSRQAYAAAREARKVAEAAKPAAVYERSGDPSANKKIADSAKPTTVYERSRDLRANKKAREAKKAADSESEATLKDDLEKKPDVEEEGKSSLIPNDHVLGVPSPNQSSPVVVESSPSDIENKADMEPSPVESSEKSSFLLEAKLVSEVSLVYAREVEEDKGEEAFGPEQTTWRWCMVGSFVLVLVMIVGILVGVLLSVSNSSEGQEEGSTPKSNLVAESAPNTSTPPDELTSKMPSSPATMVPSFFPESVAFLPNFTLEAIVKDSNSPQAEALTWVQAHPEFNNMTLWRKQQLMALCTLYYATGGDSSWTVNARRLWLKTGVTECGWHEESDCTPDGMYQELRLQESGLKGKIPPEVSLLQNLNKLWASDNELEGSLPTEIGSLTALTSLALYRNALTGPILSELGQLTSSTYLGLHQNVFAGNVPSELGQMTALTKLSLHINQLTGSIPSSLGHLTSLVQLWMHENELVGSLPTELDQLTVLMSLQMQKNSLAGPLPSELGKLTALTYLACHENAFSGTIPSELGLLTALTKLFLRDNQLTGPIPSSLGHLAGLDGLYLHRNGLNGAIPSAICNLTRLPSFWVDCDLVNCTAFVQACARGSFCVDTEDWTDSAGDDCAWYTGGDNCATFGADYGADEACCVCGGGCNPEDECYQTNNQVSLLPLAPPTGPPTPSPTSDPFCYRNPGWCAHNGSSYHFVDCDGDGFNDHVCFDSSGDGGVIFSNRGSCTDSWPNADMDDCPILFPGTRRDLQDRSPKVVAPG